MTLTKHDLAFLISDEIGLLQTQAIEVVQKTLDYIAAALANGDKVELRNFGVFEVRVTKSRVGRNPRKPEIDLQIPARATVKFRAGGELKAAVLKRSPKQKKKGA